MSVLALLLAGKQVVLPTLSWAASDLSTVWGQSIADVVWTGSNYSAAGSNGSSSNFKTAYSTTGLAWTVGISGSSPAKRFRSIECNGLQVLAGMWDGYIYYATDGGKSGFAQQTSLSSTFGTNTVWGILYAGGQWLLVGANGRYCYATNYYDSGTAGTISGWSGAIMDVAYNGKNLWVCVGDTAQCATSSDGHTWTVNTGLSSALGSYDLEAIAYGNGVWVAAGASGKLATSVNGTEWTAVTAPWGTVTVWELLFNGFFFIAVGDAGLVYLSLDGKTWVAQTAPSSEDIRGVCWNPAEKKFFIVTAAGTGFLSSVAY